MNRIQGWTVVSADYTSILLCGYKPQIAWVPLAQAAFLTEDERRNCVLWFDDEKALAEEAASEVGGHVHRVDRTE